MALRNAIQANPSAPWFVKASALILYVYMAGTLRNHDNRLRLPQTDIEMAGGGGDRGVQTACARKVGGGGTPTHVQELYF